MTEVGGGPSLTRRVQQARSPVPSLPSTPSSPLPPPTLFPVLPGGAVEFNEFFTFITLLIVCSEEFGATDGAAPGKTDSRQERGSHGLVELSGTVDRHGEGPGGSNAASPSTLERDARGLVTRQRTVLGEWKGVTGASASGGSGGRISGSVSDDGPESGPSYHRHAQNSLTPSRPSDKKDMGDGEGDLAKVVAQLRELQEESIAMTERLVRGRGGGGWTGGTYGTGALR